MASVQVLCPNGRRQTVKITANSKLLQVLEEVCQKQGFLPATEYNLVHGRTTLDLSLSFRYANLPNNVKLELVKSVEARTEGDVVIALQLENGERLQEQFASSFTLWEVLLHWENVANSRHKGILTTMDSSQNPPHHPVCIYMREEVMGEYALQNTTLKKLGLTSGKAVIRLIHRAVNDTELARIMNQLERDKAKTSKLEEIASRKLAEELAASEAMQTDEPAQITSDQQMENPVEEEEVVMEIEAGSASAIPTQMDTQIASTSTSSGNSEILKLRHMNIPGVEVITPDDFNDLSPDQQQLARELAQRVMPQLMKREPMNRQQHLGQQTNPKPRRQHAPQPANQFAEFKFPEETKGKDVYNNNLSDVNNQEYKPCDRQAVIYSLDEVCSDSDQSMPELSDDFFEITETDLKHMVAAQQKHMESLVDPPLMTSSMREARLEEQYSKYDRVVIRFQFPDRLVLQALFRPRETVFALQQFVKEYLEDKNESFCLYTSPPKKILSERSRTLIQAHLVPATVIYFGSNRSKGHHLTQTSMAEITKRRRAEEIAFSTLPNQPTPGCSTSRSSTNVSMIDRQQQRADDKDKSAASHTSGKQPKWLKLGKR